MSVKGIISILLLLLGWWFTTLCVIAFWVTYGCVKLLVCAGEAGIFN